MAASWFLPDIAEIQKPDDAHKVCTDMFQFAMTSRTGVVGSALDHVWKPAALFTNIRHIAKELNRRCLRDRDHVPLVGGRAAAAAIYPREVSCAILKG